MPALFPRFVDPHPRARILFALFCLCSLILLPAHGAAPGDGDGTSCPLIPAAGYLCPMMPVYGASFQVATTAPVNVSTTSPLHTFQTAAPTRIPVVVATTRTPVVLQTTALLPVRTAVTTKIPSLSVLQTRTLSPAVPVTPGNAPAPADGNCPPAFFFCKGSCMVDSRDNCGGCGISCRPDQQCVNGECACGRDSSLCNGVCIPTHNDTANCGGCNIRCPSNQICSNNICTCPFESGMKFCNGTCVQTGSNTQNCGECGRRCGAGQGCIDGDCITHCSGAITNLDESPLNCGECGHACAADEQCDDGACTKIPCSYNNAFCNGECVDIRENPQHCGICNRPCTYPNRFCYAGNCLPYCPGGWADCDEDGRCEDLSTGSGGYYCGACNKMCRWDEVCYGGGCHGTCPAGQTECNRGCHNLLYDPLNCGECGRKCTNTQICEAGACIPRCPEGSQRCNGTCMRWTEFYFDNNNCGSCGNRCAIVCAMGICLWG